jgi:hypothetical protein
MVTSTDEEVSYTSSIIPDNPRSGFDEDEYQDIIMYEYEEDDEDTPRRRVIVSHCHDENPSDSTEQKLPLLLLLPAHTAIRTTESCLPTAILW